MYKQKLKLQNIIATMFVPVILIASVVTSALPTSGQSSEPLSSQIDQYIQEQMAQQNIVGMSVVITRDNEISYLKGFGSASLKKQTQVTPQTIFDLASCSKSFTAMAVLLLWNDGLIDLDQTLNYYIPEFQMADEEVSRQITIRQLLNQTSGIPGNMYEPLAFQKGNDTQDSDPFKLVVAVMKRIETNRLPGSSLSTPT